MFGQNEIVGQKFFKQQDKSLKDKLLVTSVFYTLQGEGPFAGRPAVFVRLAHCNLACDFCDTYFDQGDWMTPRELYDAFLREACPHENNTLLDKVLVITGGEPMLQAALRDLVQLGSIYFDKVQVESNGLLLVERLPRSMYLVVSPKCSNGGKYLKPPQRVLARADCLKFVMSARPDNPYYELPPWAFEWRRLTGKPIYVSPMNAYRAGPALSYDSHNMEQRNAKERVSFWEPGLLDLEAVRANHEYAAKYCLDHGLYLSIQMQLFAGLP
jgi:7-carboxy-7-deazaguanine synthase